MMEIRETSTFSSWLAKLRDETAIAKISSRIQRLSFGHLGDVAPIGNGLSELRIHYGPGYRVYFLQRGNRMILLLGGGDKSSQKRDIATLKRLAKEHEE
jgi:putative addiction module killer protein